MLAHVVSIKMNSGAFHENLQITSKRQIIFFVQLKGFWVLSPDKVLQIIYYCIFCVWTKLSLMGQNVFSDL